MRSREEIEDWVKQSEYEHRKTYFRTMAILEVVLDIRELLKRGLKDESNSN